MDYSVPILSIVFIILSMLAGIAIPVLLFFLFRKKYRCDRLPFFVGCAVFFIFALLLEQLAHFLVLQTSFGTIIQQNIWLTGLYGGIMAGLFEETGRYFAFRTILKKNQDNNYNALMYGAGHGGLEAVLVLTIGMLNTLIYCIMINNGSTEVLTRGLTGDTLESLNATFLQLSVTSPGMFLVSIIERCAAVTGHIAFSVLVWFAAKKGGIFFWLYPLAILFHFLLDAGAVILNQYVPNVLITEACVCILILLFVAVSYLIWKKQKEEEDSYLHFWE